MTAVFRVPLNPRDAARVTPKWPGFVVLREDDAWHAVTNTGRPETPYFWLRMPVTSFWIDDDELVENCGDALRAAFNRAHPSGCPKVGH